MFVMSFKELPERVNFLISWASMTKVETIVSDCVISDPSSSNTGASVSTVSVSDNYLRCENLQSCSQVSLLSIYHFHKVNLSTRRYIKGVITYHDVYYYVVWYYREYSHCK